ncbi:MAG: cell division protein FtsB [Pseudomonadota bacterium]
MRWVIVVLLLVIGYLQYRLWWGEGGRLELLRLEQRVVDYERANDQLRQRNEELARQIMDLKEGSTVLEQRAREELGLTGENEVFYHIIQSKEPKSASKDSTQNDPPLGNPES